MKRTYIEPFSDIERMNRVLDRLFSASTASTTGMVMPIDVMETENALIVRASVPGLNPEQIDVTVEKNVLTLKGEHTDSQVFHDAKVYRREIVAGSSVRSVRIPEGFDLENVSADFEHGILTVTFPKLEESKPKSLKIAVKSSGTTSPAIETTGSAE